MLETVIITYRYRNTIYRTRKPQVVQNHKQVVRNILADELINYNTC